MLSHIKLKIASGVDHAKVQRFVERLRSRPHRFKQLKLTINNNQTALINARPARVAGDIPFLSVHYIFLDCSDEILDALIDMLTVHPKAEHSQMLRYYIDRYYTSVPAVIDDADLCSRGVVYDLNSLFDDMNRQYFGARLGYVRVSWMKGTHACTKKRRGVLFGSYDSRLRLIRLNPCLDRAEVPLYFVRFVLYHEMLHAMLDPERRPGKRHMVHTARFRMLEKRFPQYADAKAWEQKFLRSL